MKNRFIALISAAIMSMSMLALTACGEPENALIYSSRVEATCTADGHVEYWTDGVRYFTDADGANEVDYASLKIEKIAHTPKSAFSGNENGHYHACSKCNQPADEIVAHTFGNWVYVIPPSATVAGQGYKVCTVCSYKTPNSTIPPSGAQTQLTEIPAREPTCISAGNIRYFSDGVKYYTDAAGKNETTAQAVIRAKLPHAPAAAWNSDENDHWHMCENTYTVGDEHDAGDREAHSFVWVVDTPATSEATGLRHEQCMCGKKRNENTVIPTLGTKVHHDGVEAKCDADGNIEYWEMDGEYFSDAECTVKIDLNDTVIDALGHVEGEFVSDGAKHHRVCTRCGKAATADAACTPEAELGKTADGHYEVCSVCDGMIGAVQPHTDYGFKPVAETETHKKVCSTCGFASTPEACAAALDAVLIGDETGHHHECALCGNAIDKASHGESAYVTENGKHRMGCPDCGYSAVPETACTVAQDATYVTDGDTHGKPCEVCGVPVPSTVGNHADNEIWMSDETQHYKKCSVCDKELTAKANHDHKPTQTKPATCEAAGEITYTCECGDSYTQEDPIKAHSYTASVFVPSEDTTEAPLGGTFHKACEFCGDVGEIAIGGEWGAQAYNDRKVIIGGVEYGAYTVYTDAALKDKGVTFDAVAPDGLFVIDAEKLDPAATVEAVNTKVSILVKNGVNATIKSITACDKPITVEGEGTLSVTENISMNSGNRGDLAVTGGVTLNMGGTTTLVTLTVGGGTVNMSGTLSVINFTVGDAENNAQPNVNITVNGADGLTNAVSWHGEAATFNFLSGTVAIKQDGSGYNGINFVERSGSTITVGEHALLTVKNFDNGINGPADSVINVNGTLKIFAVGTYAWSEWGETHHYGISGFTTTVTGTLEVQSSAWGIANGAIVFENGSKAVVIRTNIGNAVFYNMTGVTVKGGADLGIKGFDRVIHGSEPTTLEIADGTMTAENVGQISQDTHITEAMYTVGTVTPGAVEIA